MRVRLFRSDPRGDRFWEVNRWGESYALAWGRVDAAQPERRSLRAPSGRAARREVDRLIAEQLARGFTEQVREDTVGLADARRLDDPVPPYDEVTQRARGASANGFAQLIDRAARGEPFTLRALLANAALQHGDGGGNVWALFLPPRAGGAWVFRVYADAPDAVDEVYPEPVFDAITRGETIAAEFRDDDAALAEVYAELAPAVDDATRERVRGELARLWSRAARLVDRLLGAGDPPQAGPLDDDADFAPELARAEFADTPGHALYWLWQTALAGDAPRLSRVREAAAGSSLRIVREALALAAARYVDGGATD